VASLQKSITIEELSGPHVKVGAVADFVRKQFIDAGIFPLLVVRSLFSTVYAACVESIDFDALGHVLCVSLEQLLAYNRVRHYPSDLERTY
jgi:hypothetical protein